jgi:hypothetical protein
MIIFYKTNMSQVSRKNYGQVLWNIYIYNRVSQDSSVGIAAGYGLDNQGEREFESW